MSWRVNNQESSFFPRAFEPTNGLSQVVDLVGCRLGGTIDVHATDVGEEEKEEKGEKEEKEWPNQLNPPPAGYSHMEMDLWS